MLMTPEEQLCCVVADVIVSQTYEEPSRSKLAFTARLQTISLTVCLQDIPLFMKVIDSTSLHWIIGEMLPWYETLHDMCSSSGSILQLFGPSNPSGFIFVWQIGVDAANNQNNCDVALNEYTPYIQFICKQQTPEYKRIYLTIKDLMKTCIFGPLVQKANGLV